MPSGRQYLNAAQINPIHTEDVMSLLNWLSGNADTEQKLQALDYQVSATNRFILERDETIQQLRKDLGNLQNNVYEATQLIVMLQQRVYKLEEAAKPTAAKAQPAKHEPKSINFSDLKRLHPKREVAPSTQKEIRRPNLIANTPQQFYDQMGGYDMMRTVTKYERFIFIQHHPSDRKPYDLIVTKGTGYQHRIKRKTFKTREEAEQFAFDVLQIHEAQCIKNNSSTKWMQNVNIFEVTPNRRSS